MSLAAVVRPVSASLAACELTHLERTPIDIGQARRQHAAYADALRNAGCRVIELAPADELPDAVFIEDCALVLDEVAVLTMPGAVSRRAELDAVAAELERHRPLLRMTLPATLDGGDVLRIGRTMHVGLSQRTNEQAIHQLGELLRPFDYAVVPIRVTGCLHLKTAVTALNDDVLVANRRWIDMRPLAGFTVVDVAEDEPFGANVLRIGDELIAASSFPHTIEAIARAGFDVHGVDMTELAKAEGGVTCCCLLLED